MSEFACPTPNLYDLPTATCNLEPPSSLSPPPPPRPSPQLPITRIQMRWQWEEMFATKWVVSSFESAMQTTPEGSHAIHHAIDSCRIRNSNLHPKGYSDRLRASWCFRGWVGSPAMSCDPVEFFLIFASINSLASHLSLCDAKSSITFPCERLVILPSNR